MSDEVQELLQDSLEFLSKAMEAAADVDPHEDIRSKIYQAFKRIRHVMSIMKKETP